MSAIRIQNLTQKYKDVTAVDHLNLEVPKGQLLSLLGVNGAGKTTTIRMLSCLLRPTAGEAWLGGHSILTEQQDVKSIIAVSPQETAIAQRLSVQENLELMAGLHDCTKRERKERAEQVMKPFGLEKYRNKQAGKLSGGWQRKLSIAMALISDPEILFLDEPTLGLDVLARSDLWDSIRELKSRMTIVLTTHYMEEAEALSNQVAIMQEGRLICTGTVEELKQRAEATTLEEAFIRIVKGGHSK